MQRVQSKLLYSREKKAGFSRKNKSKTQNKFFLFLFTRKMNKNLETERENSFLSRLYHDIKRILCIIIQEHEFILIYSHNNYMDNMQFYVASLL